MLKIRNADIFIFGNLLSLKLYSLARKMLYNRLKFNKTDQKSTNN
jgi:hypothetical protein